MINNRMNNINTVKCNYLFMPPDNRFLALKSSYMWTCVPETGVKGMDK